MNAKNMTVEKSESNSQITTLIPFPAGQPKPHDSRKWGRALESLMTVLKLTDTMRKRIPEGKFDPLWAQSALQPPPPLGKNPHYKDVVAHRQFQDVITHRKATNRKIEAQRDEWWRDSNHEFFTIIVDSMIKTNPGMYELLREKFHVSDGYYDGCAALD